MTSRTKRYRDQHDRLLKITLEISAHLNVDKLSNDANKVSNLLFKLFGTLNVHLSIENQSLYPRLLVHPNKYVRSMAKRYIEEMDNIGKAGETYNKKWMSTWKIQNNPHDFIKETNGIFSILAKRIEMENNELYKMVDELEYP